MKQITVSIPESALDAETRKQIASYKRRVANLEQKVSRLEQELSANKSLVSACVNLKLYVQDQMELHGWDDCPN